MWTRSLLGVGLLLGAFLFDESQAQYDQFLAGMSQMGYNPPPPMGYNPQPPQMGYNQPPPSYNPQPPQMGYNQPPPSMGYNNQGPPGNNIISHVNGFGATSVNPNGVNPSSGGTNQQPPIIGMGANNPTVEQFVRFLAQNPVFVQAIQNIAAAAGNGGGMRQQPGNGMPMMSMPPMGGGMQGYSFGNQQGSNFGGTASGHLATGNLALLVAQLSNQVAQLSERLQREEQREFYDEAFFDGRHFRYSADYSKNGYKHRYGGIGKHKNNYQPTKYAEKGHHHRHVYPAYKESYYPEYKERFYPYSYKRESDYPHKESYYPYNKGHYEHSFSGNKDGLPVNYEKSYFPYNKESHPTAVVYEDDYRYPSYFLKESYPVYYEESYPKESYYFPDVKKESYYENAYRPEATKEYHE